MKKLDCLVPFALFAAACGSTAGSRDTQCRSLSTGAATPTAPFTGTVFTIVMENRSVSDIFSDDDSPYVKSLAAQYAVAGKYTGPQVHPSEPNYIWMVSGENFGILDDNSPSDHHIASTSHLADQLEARGVSWKAYEESMGEPCRVDDKYPYMAKHDPFVFFDDLNGWDGKTFTRPQRCQEHVVDYSQLATDLASRKTPRYVFITPNMVHDTHDAAVGVGDKWLSEEVPKILASPAWKNGGVLFLTWDEGSFQRDDPPMIVISPLAKKGYVSQVPYDTSSYLKTVQAILGVDALPCNQSPDGVKAMDDLFTAPLPKTELPQG
jgi:phospholipase C